jgi:hypothetical protein
MSQLRFPQTDRSWYVIENKEGLFSRSEAGMCPSFYYIPALTKNKAELKTENRRVAAIILACAKLLPRLPSQGVEVASLDRAGKAQTARQRRVRLFRTLRFCTSGEPQTPTTPPHCTCFEVGVTRHGPRQRALLLSSTRAGRARWLAWCRGPSRRSSSSPRRSSPRRTSSSSPPCLGRAELPSPSPATSPPGAAK